jgi:hypothetical protein
MVNCDGAISVDPKYNLEISSNWIHQDRQQAGAKLFPIVRD